MALALLEAIKDKQPIVQNRIARIITDCQSAMAAIASISVSGNYGSVIRTIINLIELLAQRRVTIRIFWTAGHVNLRGNDLADDLAKMVAPEARTGCHNQVLSQSEAKGIIKGLIK